MTQRTRRLGAALVLDPPVADEVDGLRRALGDASFGTVPPHLTLVPPVNVHAEHVAGAAEVLRRAASEQAEPITLVLGPVLSFAPLSPVLYLGVEKSAPGQLVKLAALREALLSAPLDRPGRWPWVPHVTICDGASPESLGAAAFAFGSYLTELSFDRAVLLEHVQSHWEPLSDAQFGSPAVVGRGGLELEVGRGRLLGPEAAGVLEAAGLAHACAEASRRIVLTGRRRREIVGLAVAWCLPPPGSAVHVGVFVVPGTRGQGVGRSLLLLLEAAARDEGWALEERVYGHGPPAFFAASSAWASNFMAPR